MTAESPSRFISSFDIAANAVVANKQPTATSVSFFIFSPIAAFAAIPDPRGSGDPKSPNDRSFGKFRQAESLLEEMVVCCGVLLNDHTHSRWRVSCNVDGRVRPATTQNAVFLRLQEENGTADAKDHC